MCRNELYMYFTCGAYVYFTFTYDIRKGRDILGGGGGRSALQKSDCITFKKRNFVFSF